MTRRLAWRSKSEREPSTGFASGGAVKPSPWQKVTPGDRLWTREALWRNGGYVATDTPNIVDEGKRPAIHCPRAASRLTLIVTATKIERLQEISGDDAWREGVEKLTDAQRQFRTLWESLHGTASWDANPQVVALSFVVHRQNIDTMREAV